MKPKPTKKQIAEKLILQMANFKKLGINTEKTKESLHKTINEILIYENRQ